MAHPTTAQQAIDVAAEPRPWRVAAERLLPVVPGWPAERRAAALDRLDDAGLPTIALEDWRHTSLATYSQRWSDYLAAAPSPAVSRHAAVDRSDLTDGSAPGTVHVEVIDGELRSPTPASTPAGLTIRSLRDLEPSLQARAAELLHRSGEVAPEGMLDLNSALLTDVILVMTDSDAVLPAPVHVHLQSSGQPAFSQPRLLLDIARGSRVTVILEHTGHGGALANAATEAWVGEEAQLTLIRVQALPADGMLTETTRIELAGSSSVAITSVDLGGRLCRQAVTVLLAGYGAAATIDGMFLADGQRHIGNLTRLEHQAPATTSRETFRGIADDEGQGVFNGKVIVHPGAAGSQAALTNRNLLLAKTAEIDTKPELEIYVDDVRCSHGATTGQLDANALFYLRSRGLEPSVARQVLTTAFLRESLAGIVVPGLRTRLEAQLNSRLGDALPTEAGASS